MGGTFSSIWGWLSPPQEGGSGCVRSILPSTRHLWALPAHPGLVSPPFPRPKEYLFQPPLFSSPVIQTSLLCHWKHWESARVIFGRHGWSSAQFWNRAEAGRWENELDFKWHQMQTGNIYFGPLENVLFSSPGFPSMTRLAPMYLEILE